MKAADKLSAHLKCLEELKAGNQEFGSAAEQTRQALEDYRMPELRLFPDPFSARLFLYAGPVAGL